MKRILQVGDSILREKAKEVPISDISSAKISKILGEMREALSKEEDGVAIAAPQIGYSKRIFIVADRSFKQDDKKFERVYINPKITKISKDKNLVEEGCLSVRWKYGVLSRANKITVEAYNEKAKKFQRGASGLLAQIFQHEIDHLDGVLFIDKAKDLIEYRPETAK